MILILTGEIESGKTSVCWKMLEHTEKELSWGGIITVDHGKDRFIHDVSTGEEVLLSQRIQDEILFNQSRYHFHQSAFEFGNKVLEKCTDIPFFVCDEVGSLELDNKGLYSIFHVLEKRHALCSLLVLRKKLLQLYKKKLNSHVKVFEVTLRNRNQLHLDIVKYIQKL